MVLAFSREAGNSGLLRKKEANTVNFNEGLSSVVSQLFASDGV